MDFNSTTPDQARTLVKTVRIGWEHDIVEDETGRRVEYQLDEAGERIARVYQVPVSLTAEQLLARSKQIDVAVFQRLAEGDIEALLEVLDVFVGDDIIGRIGSDESVAVPDFMRFAAWLLSELKLDDLFGGPGN
jgi:uncharacterized protein YehS (DUF1456 family)